MKFVVAKFLLICCLFICGLAGCKPSLTRTNNDLPSAAPASIKTEDLANNVAAAHQAINSNDAEAFSEKVEFPLYVRIQQWTLGENGPLDFNLLEGKNQIIETATNLEFHDLVALINIEAAPEDMIPYSIANLADYMDGANPIWAELEITLYVSAEGDLEHIVLFGTDRKTGKVRAVYAN